MRIINVNELFIKFGFTFYLRQAPSTDVAAPPAEADAASATGAPDVVPAESSSVAAEQPADSTAAPAEVYTRYTEVVYSLRQQYCEMSTSPIRVLPTTS